MMNAKYHFMLAWLMYCWTGIAGQILSRNRHVYMSSQWSDWSGNRTVDGNNRTDAGSCGCCAATTQQTDPRITIDLGNTYLITRIRVLGRTDQHDQNLDGLVFKLDDTSFTPTTDSTPTPILSYTFILDRATAAKNVTLILPGENRILTLCEFDVFNEKFFGLEIETGNGSIINVNTDNFYDSGAMRVGPATYVKLQINGIGKYLVVCELQVFGECADGYIETDTCQTVCPDGTYGTNCAYTCGQCRNGTNCNPIDGVCQQCEDGFCDEDKTCKTPCPDQKYGGNCVMNCGHCRGAVSCNKTNGVCDECADGYMETDMLCTDLCPGGTYGKNCTDTCGYCRYGLNCSQTNGTCESCEDGYTDTTCKIPCLNGTFGRNCSQTCGHCRDGTTCNRTSGTCVGCVDGFDETDITCRTRCLGGTYGYNCTETCGQCRDGLACNTTNGVCERCADGLDETDTTCKTPCENRIYGHNCTAVCGHCKNGAICNNTNGVCDHCEDGYMETDMLCVEICPNGTYGNNCSERCGQCINGESCNQTNGNCGQCESGYTETDATCKTGAENVSRPLSSCPACPDSPDIIMIVGVTVATMLAIEGAAVVVICLVMKRKSLRKDNVGEPNPYELPDRSINEDEHQYDSAMDMNVETPNYINTGHRAI